MDQLMPIRIATRRAVHLARAVPPSAVRYAWFRTKRFVGIPTRSDRSYLARQFVTALESGNIGPSCGITASGRRDGAGAQAMARMSAMALARRYGMRYVHTPFETMDHAETAPAEWASRWERVFNLGLGEASIAGCEVPVLAIEDFMADRTWWTKPCVVSAGHYVRFTDAVPVAYRAITQDLRRKYRFAQGPRPHAGLTVCAHIRRGDVSAGDPETSHRSANVIAIENSVRQVLATAKQLRIPARVKIFSQGSPAGLERLQDLGCDLRLDTPAIATHQELVAADVLIMGRSSFSFTAALLNPGVKIYDPFSRSPLAGWLVRNASGFIPFGALKNQIYARARQINMECDASLAAKTARTPSMAILRPSFA